MLSQMATVKKEVKIPVILNNAVPDSPSRINGLEYQFPCLCHRREKEERNHPHDSEGNAVPLLPREFCERAAVFSSN